MIFEKMKYQRPDMQKTMAAFDGILKKLAEAKSAKAELIAVSDYQKLLREWETAAVLASIRHTVDTKDAFYKGENDFFDEAGPLFFDKQLALYRLLLASPRREALAESLSAFFFEKMENAVRAASPEILPLLTEENKLTARYQELYASAQVTFDGKTLTLPQLAVHKQSPDRATRRKAFKAEGQWFDEHQQEFDSLYTALVKNRTAQAKQMGHKNFVPLGLIRRGRLGYGSKEIAAFRQAVVEHMVPVVARLKKEQAQRLSVPKLKYHDNALLFPEGNPKPKGSPKELLAAGIRMYRELDPDTELFIEQMEQQNLFDLLSKPGKAPGGYCTFIAGYESPYIFANWNGTAADVDVFTHEGGHAFAAYIAAQEGYIAELREPTMEVAEVHSMSMEFLTEPAWELFFGKDTPRYARIHLEEAIAFLPYGCMVDEFQEKVYAKPSMTAQARNALWLELEAKYRPYIDFDRLPFYSRGAGWQRQLHIYMYPFYYIDYCLAQMVAFSIWQLAQQSSEEAFSRYLSLVRLAGSGSFLDILALSDLPSPFDKGQVKTIADMLKTQLWEENK